MKRARKMNAAQAWKYLALKLLEAGGIYLGLCYEIEQLRLAELITEHTFETMEAQLDEHIDDMRNRGMTVGGYLYGEHHDDGLVSFAHGMYHEERAMGCIILGLEAAQG